MRPISMAVAAAALALLAACGASSGGASSGGASSGGAGSGGAGSGGAGRAAGSQAGVEYAGCMRSHGVPKYPDPTSSNQLPSGLPKVSLQQLEVSSSRYQAAQGACVHLLPNGGQLTEAQSQQDLDAMRRFAQCMRSHGMPTWPDPTNGPAGWGFDLVNVHGFDPNSAQTGQQMDECQRVLPPGIGVPLSRPGRPG